MSQTLRFILFIGTIVLILSMIHVAVYRRLVRVWSLSTPWRRVLQVVLPLGIVLMVASRWVERSSQPGLAFGVGMVGWISVLTVVTAGVLMGLFALLSAPVRLVGRKLSASAARARTTDSARTDSARTDSARTDSAAAEPAEPQQKASAAGKQNAPVHATDGGRRDFLEKAVATGAVVLGGGSSTYAALVGRTDYTIEEIPIKLARLSPKLDGFTLVQLSDIHIGIGIGEEELAAAIDLVSSAKPDRIVLTGDLLDHDVRFADQLGRFIRKLRERAPVSAIVGNHDYYAGVREVLNTLKAAGADVLVNRSQLIEDHLVLGGVDDVWASRMNPSRGPDVARTFVGTDPDLPRVLLCHNPSYYPVAADVVDLQLSGHTHGGQYSPLVNPAKWVLRHGYVRGHYERTRGGQTDREGKSQIYVNRGFGTVGPPARIGSPPEVSKIILTAS